MEQEEVVCYLQSKHFFIKSAIQAFLGHKRLHIELQLSKILLFSHLHILCNIVSFLYGEKGTSFY